MRHKEKVEFWHPVLWGCLELSIEYYGGLAVVLHDPFDGK